MIKLKNEIFDDVPSHYMNDGDIAVITKWSDIGYHGRVVQRHKDHLITLGGDSIKSWPHWFSTYANKYESCRVKILPKGTELIVE